MGGDEKAPPAMKQKELIAVREEHKASDEMPEAMIPYL